MSQGGKGGAGDMNYSGQNVFTQAANNMAGAQNAIVGGGHWNNPEQYGNNIQPYMNPYTENVINRSMGDITQQRDEALNQVGGNAALSGAFGGSRHGLVEGTVYRDALDTAGDVSANLWTQNFQQAGQGFNQAYGRNLAGATALGNIGQQQFNMGSQINQDQIASGEISRGISQDVLDAAADMFAQYTGQPKDALATMMAALGSSDFGNTGTTTGSTETDNTAQMVAAIGALIGAFSSVRFKEGIEEDRTPSRIFGVKTYKFRYKRGMEIPGDQVGVLAEELDAIMPEAVFRDSAGRPTAVNAMPLIAELIKTVQRMQTQIDKLSDRLEG